MTIEKAESFNDEIKITSAHALRAVTKKLHVGT
jgi:hypothetical protein